jgi:hypothetical protein
MHSSAAQASPRRHARPSVHVAAGGLSQRAADVGRRQRVRVHCRGGGPRRRHAVKAGCMSSNRGHGGQKRQAAPAGPAASRLPASSAQRHRPTRFPHCSCGCVVPPPNMGSTGPACPPVRSSSLMVAKKAVKARRPCATSTTAHIWCGGWGWGGCCLGGGAEPPQSQRRRGAIGYLAAPPPPARNRFPTTSHTHPHRRATTSSLPNYSTTKGYNGRPGCFANAAQPRHPLCCQPPVVRRRGATWVTGPAAPRRSQLSPRGWSAWPAAARRCPRCARPGPRPGWGRWWSRRPCRCAPQTRRWAPPRDGTPPCSSCRGGGVEGQHCEAGVLEVGGWLALASGCVHAWGGWVGSRVEGPGGASRRGTWLGMAGREEGTSSGARGLPPLAGMGSRMRMWHARPRDTHVLMPPATPPGLLASLPSSWRTPAPSLLGAGEGPVSPSPPPHPRRRSPEQGGRDGGGGVALVHVVLQHQAGAEAGGEVGVVLVGIVWVQRVGHVCSAGCGRAAAGGVALQSPAPRAQAASQPRLTRDEGLPGARTCGNRGLPEKTAGGEAPGE